MPNPKHPHSYEPEYAEYTRKAADEFRIYSFTCNTKGEQTAKVLRWAGYRLALQNAVSRNKQMYNEDELLDLQELYDKSKMLKVMKARDKHDFSYLLGPAIEMPSLAAPGVGVPLGEALPLPQPPQKEEGRVLSVEESFALLGVPLPAAQAAPVFVEGPVQEYKPAPVVELNAFEREASRLRAMALVHRSKISALHAKDKLSYMEEHKVGLDGLPAG